jgi:flagellar hook-associated protein 3 FlgL
MLGRITTLMTQQTTLADLNQAYNRMQATQQEMASGKKINQPSDDPFGASLAIQINGDMAGLSSYSSNVADGQAWAQTADSSLANINNLTQRVRELVVQAANGTNSASNLSDMAAEVDQLTTAVKQEANTQYAGQYVFSGTASTTAPYAAATADAYQGNAGAINRQIGPGASVQVNADLSSLLGSGQSAADSKLLDVLRNISQDMKGGTAANVASLATTDLTGLDANSTTLQTLQANIGATENRLTLAASRITDLQTSDTAELSSVQDADMAQTITDYSSQQAAYTAALRASANIVQSSLLDFLK